MPATFNKRNEVPLAFLVKFTITADEKYGE